MIWTFVDKTIIHTFVDKSQAINQKYQIWLEVTLIFGKISNG